MKNNAMKNIHNMNQRALNSYASHQLNSLKNQFGAGQGGTNKKLYQTTFNTSTSGNKKVSSLWDELNEGKSKQESGNHESSNVTYIKNPPVIKQQSVQPQNLQLQQALQRIQELELALIQSRQVNEEQANTIQDKNNKIEEVSNKNMELQGKLLDKTEQITIEMNKYNAEHNKLVDTQHKLDTHKLKLNNFIDTHHNIEGQTQLVKMLGDLNIEE
jgi:small-conductance mechanosensitive channel